MAITIVYSTRKPDQHFDSHLQQTCGIKELEILAYTNLGKKSLSAIYNQALSQARYQLIVFLHDDVVFEGPQWGAKIIHHLKNSDFGILGIAGTAHLSSSGIWWQNHLTTIGIVQHQSGQQSWTSRYSGDFKERILPAVCVDGVFIAVDKNRLQTSFNENLTGFHFYDIDFCINNYLAGVKVGVIFNISLIHQSTGQLTEAWEYHRSQFLTTHQYHLPCVLKSKLIFDHEPPALTTYPKVTIIILHKSKNWLLFNCLNSLAEQSTYPHYEILIADTGSSAAELAEIQELIKTSQLKLKLLTFPTYHFAQVNNTVVFNHTDNTTELILFCNNDIELINDALSRLVQVYLDHKMNCGTIGCRLHVADKTIQHAGINLVINNNNQLQIGHQGFRSYYHYNPEGIEVDILGSTAAFLLIPRDLFHQIGGFNPNYHNCLEDVELNLASIKQGKTNYLVNHAVCYHFESQTRPTSDTITHHDYQLLLKFVLNNHNIVNKYLQHKSS